LCYFIAYSACFNRLKQVFVVNISDWLVMFAFYRSPVATSLIS